MQCVKCDMVFKTKRNLKNHLDKEIPCDLILQCENCKKIFQTKYNLQSHLNNKNKCKKMDPVTELELVKKELDFSKKEIFNLKSEVIELKTENEKLKQTIIIYDNHGTINNTINHITKINIFGNESLEHITQAILEKEILKIAEREYNNCFKRHLEFRGARYEGSSFIKMVDVHMLMTKLIYFTKKANRTMKKENDKYYINNEEGWEEVDLDQIHIQTLTKHQEVLVRFKSLIIENQVFRKTIENYFGHDDDFKLRIEAGQIEFILSDKRLRLLNKTLDYELENLDKLDSLEMNHEKNIIK